MSKKEYYKILYEFEPRNPDEMALEEGDIVIVRVQRNCMQTIIKWFFQADDSNNSYEKALAQKGGYNHFVGPLFFLLDLWHVSTL